MIERTAERAHERRRFSGYARSFIGLLHRDTRVLLREIGPFITRTIMNPLLFVFVFTYVFPKIGQGFQARGFSFATVLVPGLIAVAILFQGIAAVALPLAMELGATREIEDRLLAPLPTAAVAIEKVVFSAFQSILAAVAVFPLVYFIPTVPVAVHVSSWPLLVVVLLLASLTAGALGLTLGTLVQPKQIGLMFSIILVPVTFLGCVYYPWARLDSVPWLKYGVLVNPLVYVSEGLRASLTPELPHMQPWAFLSALTLALAVLSYFGIKGFLRRVIS